MTGHLYTTEKINNGFTEENISRFLSAYLQKFVTVKFVESHRNLIELASTIDLITIIDLFNSNITILNKEIHNIKRTFSRSLLYIHAAYLDENNQCSYIACGHESTWISQGELRTILKNQESMHLRSEEEIDQLALAMNALCAFARASIPELGLSSNTVFFSDNPQRKEISLRVKAAFQRMRDDLLVKDQSNSIPKNFIHYILLSNINGDESIYQSFRGETLPNPRYFQEALENFVSDEFGFSLLNESQEKLAEKYTEKKSGFLEVQTSEGRAAQSVAI